jgi:hypothetical protein
MAWPRSAIANASSRPVVVFAWAGCDEPIEAAEPDSAAQATGLSFMVQ